METIQEQIKRFERLQKEIHIMGLIGAPSFESAQRIYMELEALNINPITGKPILKLIKGGRFES